MTYTFDEAVEELRLAIPEKFYSPTMHDIAVMLEAQDKVINLLREEYAHTIEMTKEQREREASKIRNSVRSSIYSREFDALCEMLNLDASFAEQVRKAVGENRKFEPMYSTRYRGGETMR